MTVYSFSAFANTDFGLTADDITTGPADLTLAGSGTLMRVQDDDPMFDDEVDFGGQIEDKSSQVLAADFGVASAGQVVQSVYSWTVVNQRTGAEGKGYLVRIYDATDPNDLPAPQDGQFYRVFSIPVENGDTLSFSGSDINGEVAYADLVTDGTPCYCVGTNILTDRGEVAVETLRAGDHVVTASGDHRPIVWVGRRRIAITRHPRPDLVRPVRIEAGALGENRPRRDLLVSPEHALWLKDALVPARALINGATIRQEAWSAVHYVHVELASHDILLAEGVPAESYLDCDNRRGFDNAPAGVVTLHPDWSAQAAMRPFASAGLEAELRAAFADRAFARGRAADLWAHDVRQRALARAPRTNLVRNPRAEGAVRGRLGSGGQMPTHWALTMPDGIAVTCLGTRQEGGMPCVDFRFSGRSEGEGRVCLYPEPAGAPAEAGQDWTMSCHLRRAGGSLAGIARINLYLDEVAADGTYLDGSARPLPHPSAEHLGLQRFSATRRLLTLETARTTGYVQIEMAPGQPIDLTLRIGGVQIEQGSYASDLMLPHPGGSGPTTRWGPGEAAPERQPLRVGVRSNGRAAPLP